ncbi:MFS transporter [Occallatibacter riparius]|uniref:MFS transporter n=1 Tax=Occallatibacter riparius TaxID=1002689 RepID=A0A9J7BS39_9BACT|nr:MFS transporter [Occallatibacter riparius]UWZ85393.1 MFS transporter [Occallatibacter riparius]
MGKLPVRAVLVFWIFLLSAIAFLDRTNVSIAGPQIIREFGLDNLRMGWIISAFLIGYAASQVLAGWVAVRLGPRRALTAGVLWWGGFTLATALVPPKMRGAILVLIAVRFGLGIGEAIIYPASNQFVARWIPTRERGTVNGVIFAGVGAGAGLTPPLLVAIIASHGWRAAFWFSATVGVIAGIIWYFIARDTPEQHALVSARELSNIQAGLPEAGDKHAARTPVPWSAIFRSRTLFLLTFTYFTFGYVAWIFLGWFYMYMAQARGLNLKTSAFYTMFPFIAMTVFCLGGGVLSDWITARRGLRAGRCGVGVFSLVMTAVLLVLGSRVGSASLAAMILAAGAGVLYLCQSSFWSVSADIAGESAGVVSAVMNMGAQIGGAVTASLTPWIAQHFGWTTSFLVAAILAVAGAIAWLAVDPETKLVSAVIDNLAASKGLTQFEISRESH